MKRFLFQAMMALGLLAFPISGGLAQAAPMPVPLAYELEGKVTFVDWGKGRIGIDGTTYRLAASVRLIDAESGRLLDAASLKPGTLVGYQPVEGGSGGLGSITTLLLLEKVE